MPTGIDYIAAERERQPQLGYSLDHDLQHADGTLAFAAACYAAPDTVYLVRQGIDSVQWVEPWPRGWSRVPRITSAADLPPRLRLRELAKAGALIAAEIDVLLASSGEDLDDEPGDDADDA